MLTCRACERTVFEFCCRDTIHSCLRYEIRIDAGATNVQAPAARRWPAAKDPEMNARKLLKVIEQTVRDRLTELDLSNEGIESLPPEVGELKNLTRLKLNGNRLSSLPPEIGDLQSLAELWVAENRLTYLPAEIGNLKTLSKLYLWKNQLSSLPPEIGDLKNLTNISLAGNRLRRLPAEIGKLENLAELWIAQNQLDSLPEEIGNLKKLQRLSMWQNQLTDISLLMGLPHLKWLDLCENRISRLPGQIVDMGMGIRSQREQDPDGIFLADNPLESPPPEIVNQGTEAVRDYFRSLETEG